MNNDVEDDFTPKLFSISMILTITFLIVGIVAASDHDLLSIMWFIFMAICLGSAIYLFTREKPKPDSYKGTAYDRY